MEITKTHPASLQGYVSFFYTVRAIESPYIFRGGQGIAQRRLPDGTLDIIFNLGGKVELSRDGLHFEPMPAAAVTGLYPDRTFVKYNRDVHLVGAVFQPGSAHLFINEILTQFRADTVDAALVFGQEAYRLLEQLNETSGNREKHHLLELFLLRYLGKNKEEDTYTRISSAVGQIHRFNGSLGMQDLQEHCLMSERNFRRKFNEFVGMSPKQYAGIVRVKEFTKIYVSHSSSYQAHLLRAGYTDHAHFNKDFHRITGVAPNTFFKGMQLMDTGFIHLI
jgi:AraC-like DNA-binding protein